MKILVLYCIKQTHIYTVSLKEVKPRLAILFWRPDIADSLVCLGYVFLTEESGNIN